MIILCMQLGSQVGQCSTKARFNRKHLLSISVFSGDSGIISAALTGNHVGVKCQVSHMAWSHCYDPFYCSWCLLHCLLGCHKPIIRGNFSFIISISKLFLLFYIIATTKKIHKIFIGHQIKNSLILT